MSLSFHVEGDPAPQGSKRHVGHGILIESSKRVKPWRARVEAAARAAMQDSATRWKSAPLAPVTLHATFYICRPKSHYGTGRNVGIVKATAPAHPTSRAVGDLDKLLRSTLDALTMAGAIRDDSDVVRVNAQKLWADSARPGASIWLEVAA